MNDLQQFCSTFDISEAVARQTLDEERARASSALATPWYVRLVAGIGAWVTAIAGIVLGGAILSLIAAESIGALAGLGLVYFALGLWALRNSGSHMFVTQMGIAAAAAGIAMATAGMGLQQESVWAATVVSVALTVVVILLSSNLGLQFLAALLAASMTVIALLAEGVPYYLDIVALAGPIGLFLMLRPMSRDLQPTAILLLLMFPLLGVFGPGMGGIYFATTASGGWFAKALHIGLFILLAAIHWQHAASVDARYRLSIVGVAAVLVGLLLPPGGSAVLVILMLAFVLGNRQLAVLGTMLQIYYLWRFYYDLQITLLVKSEVLTAVGVLLLLAWWLIQRRMVTEVRP